MNPDLKTSNDFQDKPAVLRAARPSPADSAGTRILACAGLVFALLLLLTPPAQASQSWAVYWYLCGSDLESDNAAASADLAEALKARLPDNVTVVVQTGGARRWHSQGISARHIERYVVRRGKLERVAQLPQANMGDAGTLASFLAFCKEKYPADRRALVFWDHGGGSIGGLANDENYDSDALSLAELRQAFSKVFGASPQEPPFEVIGFDTCLMATLDTAATMHGFGKYMVASQELEPGNGWQYTEWLSALGRDTGMDGAKLGKIMCDSYLQGCKDEDTEDDATLSVVDLSQIPLLLLTYNALGLEAVSVVVENDNFYGIFGRQANAAENYMNSRSQGFSNMVDIRSLVQNLEKHLPEFTPSVLEALDEAVIYKVNGPLRNSSGISCYYPYDGRKESFRKMVQLGHITSFLVLNGLQFGFMDTETAQAHLERIAQEISAALEEGDEGEGQTGEEQTGTPAPTGLPFQSAGSDTDETPLLSQSMLTGLSALLTGKPQEPQTQPTPSTPSSPGQSGASPLANLINAYGGGSGGSSGVNVAGILTMFNQVSANMLSQVVSLTSTDISQLEEHPVEVSGEGAAVLTLGPEKTALLDSVNFYLAVFSEEDDVILLLGKDADLDADWDAGVFKDNFRGVWPALDGNYVYMEITHSTERYNHYTVPIKLNGVLSTLFVVYDFENENYRILGARKVMNNDIADKCLTKLKAGDKVNVILRAMTINGDDEEYQDIEMDEFVLGEKQVFEDIDLGDGNFIFLFEMSDVQNNTAQSQAVHIEVKDGVASYEDV